MKSAEDFAAAVAGMAYRSDRREAIKARDAEVTADVVERCAKIAVDWAKDRRLTGLSLQAAIRAVAKPPESPRERLGRVLWERVYANPAEIPWRAEEAEIRVRYMDYAEAVRQEIAKMRGEE